MTKAIESLKENKEMNPVTHLFNNDIIFKSAFRFEEALKDLIYYGLDIKAKSVKLVDKEMPNKSYEEKHNTLDLLCITDNDEVISIEVNNEYRDDTYLRNLLYYCKILALALEKAEDYTKISRHIQLNLTWNIQRYFPFLNANEVPIIKMFVKEDSTNTIMLQKYFTIVTINMDFFTNLAYTKDISKRDKFFKFISSRNEEELDEFSKGDKVMSELGKEVKKLNQDPYILEKIRIENEDKKWNNTYFSRGKMEGEAKGKKDALYETAKKMLKDNMSDEIISKYTNLSIDEINNIKNN